MLVIQQTTEGIEVWDCIVRRHGHIIAKVVTPLTQDESEEKHSKMLRFFFKSP